MNNHAYDAAAHEREHHAALATVRSAGYKRYLRSSTVFCAVTAAMALVAFMLVFRSTPEGYRSPMGSAASHYYGRAGDPIVLDSTQPASGSGARHTTAGPLAPVGPHVVLRNSDPCVLSRADLNRAGIATPLFQASSVQDSDEDSTMGTALGTVNLSFMLKERIRTASLNPPGLPALQRVVRCTYRVSNDIKHWVSVDEYTWRVHPTPANITEIMKANSDINRDNQGNIPRFSYSWSPTADKPGIAYCEVLVYDALRVVTAGDADCGHAKSLAESVVHHR